MLLQRILNRIWLHKDCQLSPKSGVTYAVRYVGAMPIVVSMRSVEFELRNYVTFQCINLVCEAAGIKLKHKEKSVDETVPLSKLISGQPLLQDSASQVDININTEFLSLVRRENDQIIAHYKLCNVSFASGGSTDTTYFVAFVAKDHNSIRLCHVIECSKNVAGEVITSIGQAFEISHKKLFEKNRNKEKNIPSDASAALNQCSTDLNEASKNCTSEIPMRQVHIGTVANEPLVDIEPSSSLPLEQRISWGLYSLPNKVNCLLMEELSDEVEAPELLPRPDEVNLREPSEESWYHCALDREDAEKLLQFDGDFLVRKKMRQFVLSVRNASRTYHLLLVKEDGLIRTKEKIFGNVSNLVNFYLETQTPLITKLTRTQLYLQRAIGSAKCTDGETMASS